MSSQYDSILKEKKKYQEIVDERHFLRKYALLIDFIIIIIILIISFYIYLTKILSPSQIIIDDLKDFNKNIDTIYKHLILDYDFSKDYSLIGNVEFKIDASYETEEINFLNNLTLDYNISKQDNQNSVNISSDKYNLDFYENKEISYLNYDNNFIKFNNLNITTNIEDYLYTKDLIKEQFIKELTNLNLKKTMFISDKKLVASVNLTLTGQDINKIYNNIINKLKQDNISSKVINTLSLNNSLVSNDNIYTLTIKNDALKNELIDFKLVINENENRTLITYKDNTINYKDNFNEYKIVIKTDANDFQIRIYDKEEMKYIISGKEMDNSYTYTYQVIKVIDNINLQIKKDNSTNTYNLNIKKSNDTDYLYLDINMNINYSHNVAIDKNILDNYKEYETLTKEEKIATNNYTTKIFNDLTNVLKSVNFM